MIQKRLSNEAAENRERGSHAAPRGRERKKPSILTRHDKSIRGKYDVIRHPGTRPKLVGISLSNDDDSDDDFPDAIGMRDKKRICYASCSIISHDRFK